MEERVVFEEEDMGGIMEDASEPQTRPEKALAIIEEALFSDEFRTFQTDFVHKNAHLFVEGQDLPPEAMLVYNSYVEGVESHLLAGITKEIPDFDFEELIQYMATADSEGPHMEAFDAIKAAIDFSSFQEMMESYQRGAGLGLEITVIGI